MHPLKNLPLNVHIHLSSSIHRLLKGGGGEKKENPMGFACKRSPSLCPSGSSQNSLSFRMAELFGVTHSHSEGWTWFFTFPE